MNQLLLFLLNQLENGVPWTRTNEIAIQTSTKKYVSQTRTLVIRRAEFFGHLKVKRETHNKRYVALTKRGIEHLAYLGLISEERAEKAKKLLESFSALYGEGP